MGDGGEAERESLVEGAGHCDRATKPIKVRTWASEMETSEVSARALQS